MKYTSKLLALALLVSTALPLLAMRPVATRQRITAPHDHAPRVHLRFLSGHSNR